MSPGQEARRNLSVDAGWVTRDMPSMRTIRRPESTVDNAVDLLGLVLMPGLSSGTIHPPAPNPPHGFARRRMFPSARQVPAGGRHSFLQKAAARPMIDPGPQVARSRRTIFKCEQRRQSDPLHLSGRCRKLRQRPLLTDIGPWVGADCRHAGPAGLPPWGGKAGDKVLGFMKRPVGRLRGRGRLHFELANTDYHKAIGPVARRPRSGFNRGIDS